ncbi:poly [ADP-ribose] polymerase 2-like [Oscarella lobularis]|uniref:poly [ADP-ribose] polymerase 2-like n=1 Tax=Oscarella lobularis TaxID=121494 RepID=UPI003313B3DA
MSSKRARNQIVKSKLLKSVAAYEQGTSSIALALYVDPATRKVDYCGNKDFAEIVIDALETSGKKEEVTALIQRMMTSKKRTKGKRRQEVHGKRVQMPDPSIMSAPELRYWIPTMVVNTTGEGQPHWDKEEKRVPWWPAGLPFKSPRTDWRPKKDRGSPKFVTILRSIATSYKNWLSKQDFLDDLSDEDAGDDETSNDEADAEGPSRSAKRPRLRGIRPDEFFGRHDDDGDDGDDGDSRPEEAEDEPHSGPVQIPESKLNKRVQELIEIIFDIRTMEKVVQEMNYDVEKAPLGKLTKARIKAGFSALKKIEACIISHRRGELRQACNEFYYHIPHASDIDRPLLIESKEIVREKASLLETLGNIEIAMKILQRTGHKTSNPIDSQYAALQCGLNPLEKDTREYATIVRAITSTQEETCTPYSLEVMDIFGVRKKTQFKDVGNKVLLWHGSPATNLAGILGKGLQIAPPETPSTGYTFGKGVYFYDVCSRSAKFCNSSRSQNVGFILLCEVSLGVSNDLLSPDSRADRLPEGKSSVKGLGQVAPSKSKALPDSSVLFLGPNRETGVENPAGYTLYHNEFVVYDTRQIRMRYVVKVRFNYRSPVPAPFFL